MSVFLVYLVLLSRITHRLYRGHRRQIERENVINWPRHGIAGIRHECRILRVAF